MNPHRIRELALATASGDLPFPAIVAALVTEGVEYYFVDYASLEMRFYGAGGQVVDTPLALQLASAVAANFDRTDLRAAILDSQVNGQHFKDFSNRAVAAGVTGYLAFLRGQRVTYFGRQGDQHVEWFPGAKPQRPDEQGQARW